MPIFGVTTIGTYTPNQSFRNEITGGLFTCPEDGRAESITVYLRYAGVDGKSKCAIYDSSGNFVAGTEEITTLVPTYEGWRTYSFATPASLSGGQDYYLVIWGTVPPISSWNHLARDSGYPDEQKSEVVAYDGWPATFSPGEAPYRLTIYCTYAPTGPMGPSKAYALAREEL